MPGQSLRAWLRHCCCMCVCMCKNGVEFYGLESNIDKYDNGHLKIFDKIQKPNKTFNF